MPARFFLPASALATLIPQSAEAIGVISGLLIQPKGSRTMAKKKDKDGLKKQRDVLKQKLGVLNVQINDLEDELRT